MKIIKTGLNIAAGTLFLSAVSPAVNVMNQVGLGASVPVQIQTLSNVSETLHQFAESAIAASGLPTAPAGMAIGPNLEAPGHLEFAQ
ncbi:hypothetical protein [Acetobacter fabarum]|uniref:Uncharacterized protein n=1 Tax=Acetobacter fabarum TaxID=483199 RepID=A0A269XV85_9PROT|nr:hypothetical protein [Acetobacter fabarum]PAK77170.1 hypothetical protein B8X00_11430 [Acetobacter fabarum]PEN22950.1 hypothetical protein CRM93_12760 [Acetobacter fabarum]